jgi:MazG family protein
MSKTFADLVAIIAKLRDPVSGCPWDIAQTHKSLKTYLLEESYEVLDAIDSESGVSLKEELGDLLLQVLLHAQIAKDNQSFTIEEVIDTLTQKLIYRHPHIFNQSSSLKSEEYLDADRVKAQWEALKKASRKEKGLDQKIGILGDLPKNLPALLQAQKVSEKAASVGFEWPTFSAVREQALSEIAELITEFNKEEDPNLKGDSRSEEEFGDLLFALVQLGRRSKIDAESALLKATTKFTKRLQMVETLAKQEKKELQELSLTELNSYWAQVKVAT